MNDKENLRLLRREFNASGIALIIYLLLMNVCVLGVMMLDVVVQIVSQAMEIGLDAAMYRMEDYLMETAMGNGWGYLLACILGGVVLLLWKKKEFCFQTIWTKGAPMKAPDFFMLLCIFTSGQLIFQIMATAMEFLLNQLGMSMMESIEAAAAQTDTSSMFLYMGLFAPVFEEIVFRGLILRTLLPHGKKFAILVSAILFGVFHGNPAQTPYAFAVGLVLGYVAVEYNIGWAMVLHMGNNLILGDTMSRLLNLLPENLGALLFSALMLLVGIAAVIIMAVKRWQIVAYLRKEEMDDFRIRAFFTAPANLILILYMVFNMVLTVAMSAF